jgi:outer membrane protein
MKKYALIAALLVASASSAQSIVAHVNVDSLLVQMPEYKLAQEALQAEQVKFESEAKEMNAELEKGAQALQANAATWTELRQRQEQTRLQEMYNNIQEYMQQAQSQLAQMGAWCKGDGRERSGEAREQ